MRDRRRVVGWERERVDAVDHWLWLVKNGGPECAGLNRDHGVTGRVIVVRSFIYNP